ncbi:hypothetical protein yfred0001_14410 [Yersinia frederiksenii ATCC 33641]|nr:hypothetical protein yfred0001_14410 [Yersinia frederiksenii ATCC 33641]
MINIEIIKRNITMTRYCHIALVINMNTVSNCFINYHFM